MAAAPSTSLRPSFELEESDEDIKPSFPVRAHPGDLSKLTQEEFWEIQQGVALARVNEAYAALMGHYRLFVPDPKDLTKRRRLDECPGSPLCPPGGDCPWPQRRHAIVSSWSHLDKDRRGLGMLSQSDLELVLEYSRDHPKADIRHIPPLTPLRLDWCDPREGGKQGRWHFEAYDSASLAMELHMINRGIVDEYKVLDGGLMYLIGEPQLFWPMMINYRLAGSCCPPFPPGAPISTYAECIPTRTLEHFHTTLKDRIRSSPTGLRGTTQRGDSRNMTTVAFIRNVNRMSMFPADMQSSNALPQTYAELPKWWRDAVEPWDRMIKTAMRDPNKISNLACLFYCTPAGCVAHQHDRCPLLHDEGLKAIVEDLKLHPRQCSACGSYAELRCSRCGVVRYCSRPCQERHWRSHKPLCSKPA